MKKKQLDDKDRFREYVDKGNDYAYKKLDIEKGIEFYEKAHGHCAFKGDREELFVTLKHLDLEKGKLAKTLLKEIEERASSVADHCILSIILADVFKEKSLFHLREASKLVKTQKEKGWMREAAEKLGIVLVKK